MTEDAQTKEILDEIVREHRELDSKLHDMENDITITDDALRELKKKKLHLKDRIDLLQDQLQHGEKTMGSPE